MPPTSDIALGTIFPGATEMAERMRALDWAATELGPPEAWPENLRVAVGLCLGSPAPIVLSWGEQCIVLYNDACIPFLGPRHPQALGRPARECWPERWHVLGPMLDGVMRTGAGAASHDELTVVARTLPRQEAYISCSYGPIRSATDGSRVEGVFACCSETTTQVIRARRITTLRALSVPAAAARSIDAACLHTAKALGDNPYDVPFAGIYLVDDDGARAVLNIAVGFGADASPLPASASLADGDIALWPLAMVLREHRAVETGDLVAAGLRLPGGPWPDASARAVLLPLFAARRDRLAGIAVLGVSPCLPLEHGYRAFFALIADHLGTAISAARNEELAAELAAMTRLHELSMRLISQTGLQPILEEVLSATLALQGADFGNVQLYNPELRGLEIVAHRGFQQEVIDRYKVVTYEGACGRALQTGRRCIVEDVLTEPFFAPWRAHAEAAGVRAVQSTPMFSRSGEPLGVLTTYFRQPHRSSERDLRITDLYVRQAAEVIERLRAQEALRASEERFRRWFELGLIGMAITSRAKACTAVNDELCRILGYSRGELLQRSWPEMTHPEDLAADVASFERVMAGEIDGYSMEKRWIRKDGEVIHSIMSAKCVRAADGSVDYLVALVLDITERKRAEEALRLSATLLAEAQRLSHTGSWSWNVATGEIDWSEELYRIGGFAPGQVRPTDESAMLIHPDDRAWTAEVVTRGVAERGPFEMKHRILLADGTVKHLHAVARPRPATLHAAELIYDGVLMDITERKRAEVAADKAQADLARVTRLTALGELAAAIAHEVNQPLGAIVNNGNVCLRLLEGTPASKEAREAVQDIVNDANRASDIIKHVRALTNAVALKRTSFSVCDLVHDVLGLTQRQLAEGQITVETQLAAGLPRVSADRVQLQQLLLNLVTNAIEAMLPVEERPRVLTIGACTDELQGIAAVAISVSDAGVGFDPAEVERLFEPFHTTKQSGMGMGLRISRSIVEAHGGRLWATSGRGAGATFHCLIPVES